MQHPNLTQFPLNELKDFPEHPNLPTLPTLAALASPLPSVENPKS